MTEPAPMQENRLNGMYVPYWTYDSNKPYRFLINGRTGEVQGERPWSWAKILLLVLGIAAAIIIAIAAISQA